MESERDWMAVSETVVQILGEPCLLSLLRSSTWNKEDSELRRAVCSIMLFILMIQNIL